MNNDSIIQINLLMENVCRVCRKWDVKWKFTPEHISCFFHVAHLEHPHYDRGRSAHNAKQVHRHVAAHRICVTKWNRSGTDTDRKYLLTSFTFMVCTGKKIAIARFSVCAPSERAWVSARQFFRARDRIQRQSCKKKKKERRSISCRHENNTEVSYLRSSEVRRNRGTISCVQFYRTDKSIAAISYIVSRSILAIGFIRALFAIAIAAGQIKK